MNQPVKCTSKSLWDKVLAAIAEDQRFFSSLQVMVHNGMIDPEKARKSEVNYKEKRLKDTLSIDTAAIGTYGKYDRAFIHIGAKLQRELQKPTDTITARNKEELIDKLYDLFFGKEAYTVNKCFELYSVWRFEIGTRSKTLKEDIFLWNRFFRDLIGNEPIRKITVPVVRDLFLRMTANNGITRKCFNSAKSVLNGVFQYCLEQGHIDENPVCRINLVQFSKRFKPEEAKKDYTREEVATIVCSLRSSDDVYDCAIRFAFNACLRFGELRSIRYSDVKDGILTIRRSSSDVNPAFLDDDGHVAFSRTVTEETYTKGATSEGIRDFPLTPEAEEIIEELHRRYPENEYVFMSNGAPLKIVTFNRHLKKVCEENHIEYRSSHVIRFTNCDALFNEANVSIQSMQSYMGHSKVSMTDHYIARHKSKEDDNEKVISFLKIV